MKSMARDVRFGEAGVLRVAAELLLRNLRPFYPFVDDHGTDLMLQNRLRLQVKTSKLGKATPKIGRLVRLCENRWDFLANPDPKAFAKEFVEVREELSEVSELEQLVAKS